MQISKQQLETILQNAPPGVDKVGVIEGLYNKGVTVQGVDSYDARNFISQYKTTQAQTNLAELAEQEVAPEFDNVGTGFDPSFESEADDSAVVSVAKAIGNVPKSTYMLGKDVVTAVANPIETATTIGKLIKGVGGKGAEKVLENTGFGQSILEKINEVRMQNGGESLARGEDGRLQVAPTEEIEIANQVGTYFTERYGSFDNFKESAIEDPAGVLSDIASVVSGAGAIVKTAGNTSRVSRISDIGATIQRAGDALEPVTAAQRGVSAVVGGASNTLAGRVIGEAAPTPGRFAEGEIVKALDLTQGDVRRIAETTGNDVADFVSRNNLLKETPEEIAMALEDFKTNQYDLVRTEVARVPEIYTATNVPRVRDALTAVKDVVDDVPGLEEAAAEVNRLINQDTYSLSDVQRVKEILDERTNIFTRSGDVRDAAKAQGLANVRSDLRSFIETEVSRATDGQTNIQKLNNDVATSRELADAIELRETRDLTRNYSPLTSTLLGGAAFAGTGDIYTALGVAALSKVAQTPSFRIALARVLKATPVQDLQRWSGEIAEKNLSPQTRQALLSVIEEARRNAEFIEAGSQVVEEASLETTQ